MPGLEEALQLRTHGPDRWVAFADPDHESISGMFGGWTAAVMLGAVERSAAGTATPSALTVNFLGPIAPGGDVAVTVHRLRGGRSIEHWRADARLSRSDDVLASALVVLANRRPTDGHCQWTMPDAPEPDTLEQIESPGPQGKQTMIRTISGEYASAAMLPSVGKPRALRRSEWRSTGELIRATWGVQRDFDPLTFWPAELERRKVAS